MPNKYVLTSVKLVKTYLSINVKLGALANFMIISRSDSAEFHAFPLFMMLVDRAERGIADAGPIYVYLHIYTECGQVRQIQIA